MSINLSNLSTEEKNRVELDKQAAFVVWKIKQAKVGNGIIESTCSQLTSQQDIEIFKSSIEKYKSLMGVV